MLTREAILAVDMSVQRPLQRSSWKAEAIRRGDIKISGPIPIIQDVTLADEEEVKFADKGSFDGSLQPHEVTDQQSQRPETPPVPSGPHLRIPSQPSALRSNPVDNHLLQEDEAPEAPQRQAPERPQRQAPEAPQHQAPEVSQGQAPTSPPIEAEENEMRPASIIAEPALSPPGVQTTEVATKAAQKKKRKSGLRQVFRKMFGRKSRDESEVQQVPAVRRGHSYHHSDPGMLSQSSPREPRNTNGLRISDLTVQEPKPPHPLGQHLPFPMNVNAPQASPPQEYLTFDLQRPRRVTLPNLPGATMQRRSLGDVRGRLSSWDEKQDDESLHSPGIGIAFSSPTQATPPSKSNRRSRSAGALRDLAKGQLSSERRRSAEIRYWRASYASGSVYSRPETAKTVETVRNVSAQEPTILEQGPESALEMSATLVHADDEEMPEQAETEVDGERDGEGSVSAFNFGNLKSGFLDEEAAIEPGEAVEAPPSPNQHPPPVPIEDRLQHLESKCDNLESTVRRLSTRNNRHTIILENAPKNLRSRDRSSSARSAPSSRLHSTPSIQEDPVPQSNSATVVPSVPSPMFGKDGGEPAQCTLESMYESLKYEREARKTLEIQVETLQQDVSDLHALINKLVASGIATSPSYPTPSPDALIISTENRLLTPRAIGSESLELPYAKGKDEIRASAISKFSYSETGSESGPEEDLELEKLSTEGSCDELGSPDIWATPKEEKFAGSGFFYGKRSRDNLKGFI